MTLNFINCTPAAAARSLHGTQWRVGCCCVASRPTFTGRNGRRVHACRRPQASAMRMAADMGQIKPQTKGLDTYVLCDNDGTPIFQPMFGGADDTTYGTVYFLSCEFASQILAQIQQLPDFSEEKGTRLAVVPFYKAYERVVGDSIKTEETTESGAPINIIFRFAAGVEELQYAQSVQGGVAEIPEIPVFYRNCLRTTVAEESAPLLFISPQDCDAAYEDYRIMHEDEPDSDVRVADLMVEISQGKKFKVVPSVRNDVYVKKIFDRALT